MKTEGLESITTSMKAHGSKIQDKKPPVRKTLATLQPSALDKENLVGGRRMVESEEEKISGKTKVLNEKNIELNKSCSILKKKPLAKHSSKPKSKIITAEDLTSEKPSETYWQVLAEKRRNALEETLKENQSLHERLEQLEQENSVLKNMLKETETLVETLLEMVGDKDTEESAGEDEGPVEDVAGELV